MRVFSLENHIQRYAWGSRTGLVETLGLSNPEGAPLAELWMGAHPKAPSLARLDSGVRPLDALIAEDPAGCLGAEVLESFGPNLPFLFKALSAATPLSIQAHPGKRKAEHGFERENLAGIPVDAPERNYRDANHKPETTVALTRFQGLCGFRPIEEIIEHLRLLAPESFEQLAGRLVRDPGRIELSVLVYSMISAAPEQKRKTIEKARPLVERILAEGRAPAGREEAFRWVARLFELYPGDVGAFAPLLLNHVVLEPGEAVAIPPGELHAYLEGTALEIMANSDNVIRGGLTPKHIDVPELISVLSFKPERAASFLPTRVAPDEELYPPFAPDFQLSRIAPRPGAAAARRPSGPEILLCVEGRLLLEEGGGTLELGRGSSAFVRADAGEYRLSGEGLAYRASVPPRGAVPPA